MSAPRTEAAIGPVLVARPRPRSAVAPRQGGGAAGDRQAWGIRAVGGERRRRLRLWPSFCRVSDTAGRLKESVARVRQAASAAPRSQSTCVALAQALLRSGDLSGARETVEKGLAPDAALDPFLAYERPALRLGTRLVESLEKEGGR